jgi:hypothetical protein
MRNLLAEITFLLRQMPWLYVIGIGMAISLAFIPFYFQTVVGVMSGTFGLACIAYIHKLSYAKILNRFRRTRTKTYLWVEFLMTGFFFPLITLFALVVIYQFKRNLVDTQLPGLLGSQFIGMVLLVIIAGIDMLDSWWKDRSQGDKSQRST